MIWPLDLFERWINEHGSAAILKERIALANDRYAELERKLAVAVSARDEMQEERDRLRIELTEAQTRLALTSSTSSGKAAADDKPLGELDQKVLIMVCHTPGITDMEVARQFALTVPLATFILESLGARRLIQARNRHFATDWSDQPDHCSWFIQQLGRAYLSEHGLLL